jgi:hypothetical protein
MAQVTISGGIAYGYQSTTTTADAVAAVAATPGDAGTAAVAAKSNEKASGFGMDTAAVTFAAKEDLGNGITLSGKISMGGLARGDGVEGEDMSMSLAGGFGTVTMGQIEIGSGIRGLAQAGAPVNNMEGEVLLSATAGTDIVSYTAPTMAGFTFSANQTEAKGIATGLDDSTKGTSARTVALAYAAGPFQAKVDVTNWNSAAAAGKADDRFRFSAQYDLGVAKIGAGIEDQDLVGGGSNKYTMVGVSVPMGALTVGAVMVTNDTSATPGKKDGYSVGAKYALSKRTSLIANMAEWDYKEGSTIANKKTTVLLDHSF